MKSMTSARLDETFEMLTHSYRRFVLYYLRSHSEVADIDTLSALLATELEGQSATGGRKTPEHIKVALHHIHLPKLADAGLITFAEDRQSVALNGTTSHGQFIDQAARIDGYGPPAAGD